MIAFAEKTAAKIIKDLYDNKPVVTS